MSDLIAAGDSPPVGRAAPRAGAGKLARRRPRSMASMVGRTFIRNRTAVAGLVVLTFIVAVAVLAPVIAPFGFDVPSRSAREAPSGEHWFGTDTLGRDIYSRVLYGARISIGIGLFSVAIGLVIGGMLGLLSGYLGRRVDSAVGIGTDILLAFPGVLLALVVIAVLGRGLTNVVIAVGIASIPSYTRLVRSQVIAAKELAYVEAARVVGSSPGRVMMRHLLPNVLGPVTVLATLSIASAILSAAGLSYLGLGAQPPTPEWGAMVSDGREHLRSYWWMSTMPGFAIMLTVLAINLVGDGLRDAFDPRLRR